jgi:hypothetical protein
MHGPWTESRAVRCASLASAAAGVTLAVTQQIIEGDGHASQEPSELLGGRIRVLGVLEGLL